VALTDTPSTFQPDDEEEVRIAIAHHFRELGFEATEMSLEGDESQLDRRPQKLSELA